MYPDVSYYYYDIPEYEMCEYEDDYGMDFFPQIPPPPSPMTTIVPFMIPWPMGNGLGISPFDGGIPSVPFMPNFKPRGVGGPIFPEKMKNLTKGEWPFPFPNPWDKNPPIEEHKHKSHEIPFPFMNAALLRSKFPMPVPLASKPRFTKQAFSNHKSLLGFVNKASNYVPAQIPTVPKSEYIPPVPAVPSILK